LYHGRKLSPYLWDHLAAMWYFRNAQYHLTIILGI
jgi:hypothetical protein